jgi:hypothetical protein
MAVPMFISDDLSNEAKQLKVWTSSKAAKAANGKL